MSIGDWIGYLLMYGGGAALVVWVFWIMLQHDLAQRRVLEELVAGGFNINHRIGRTTAVVFDDSLREMAIIVGETLYRYPYSQIDSWAHECFVRNGVQTRNKFVINVLDPYNPRHEITVSASEGRLWLAKMPAILAH